MPSSAVYRRRRQVAFGGASAVLLGVMYAVATLVAPLPAAAVTYTAAPAQTQNGTALVMPGYGESAIAADGFGTLATDGPQDQVPIASITKVITALVVLDAHALADATDQGPTLTFTQRDIDILQQTQAEFGSFGSLPDTMQLSEKHSLTMMLMVSANNYAVSLATWAYGSMDAYLAAANSWLAAKGLTGTVVDDASGISSGSRSTPADMLTIGALVMADASLAQIVGTPSANIPGVGLIENTNTMLGIDGINGIKTGTTVDAGATLLYSAVLPVGAQSIHVIGVILGAESHEQLNTSLRNLLASVHANFQEVRLSTADEVVGTALTAWGTTANIAATETVSRIVYSSLPITVTPIVKGVTTGAGGTNVGSLEITIGDEKLSIPLALLTTLEDPGAGWRLTHAGELF